jgi:hypothetical protein
VDHRPACSLCLHSCDERWIGDGTRSFCTSCLAAIGRYVSNGPGRARLWPALEGAPNDQTALRETEAGEGDTQVDGDEPAAQVFVDLTKGSHELVNPADADTHLALAVAYCEMGIVGDALREAAVALRHEKRLSRSSAREAMSLLLDARHLRVGVDELLVALRNAVFTN